MKVDIRELPEYHVAYIRHVGAYAGIFEAFQKISHWAQEEGLLGSEKMMGIYWDDPNVVSEEKLRSDACIPVSKNQRVSGEVQLQSMKGGLFAVYPCEIRDGNFNKPWLDLMDYLTRTEYEFIDKPGYEIYHNDGHKDPEGKWVLDICMPVKKKVAK